MKIAMSEYFSFRIPIIDFELLKKRDEATRSAFLKAITDIGFFILKNHDVPRELTDRLERVSENFYRTTSEERMKVKEYEGKMVAEGDIFAEEAFKNSP